MQNRSSEIAGAFARVVAERPRHTAVIGLSEGVARTFEDLAADVDVMRAALDAHHDLPASPCIVSTVGNRVGFISLLLASLDRGAAFVLLDGDATELEVDAAAQRFGAHAIVRRARPAAARRASAALPGGLELTRTTASDPPAWRTGLRDEPVVLKLTSGSTHRPKAVVATEAQLTSDARHLIEAMRITPSDVTLAAIPISHAYAMGMMLVPMLMQGTTLALRDSFAPKELAGDIIACGVTAMGGVPFMYDYLRRHGHAGSVLAPVRLLVTAGAPIDLDALTYFKERAGKKLHSLYGTSETGGITFDDTGDVHDPLTVGRPLPGTKVTLMPSPAAGPEEGRLHVSGDAVATRYAMGEDDVEPLSAFTPDGFLTGDLARIQPDGHVVLTGRVSRFVNVAGRKVHPEEVERVIAAVPGVWQASVLGAPHPSRGQMLVACVRRRDGGLSAAEIRAACATKLSAHKIPRRIVFTDDLPVDARGKIDRGALEALVHRTLAEEGPADAV
jgi:acyl-CoA synthetase (AMP-forming)/AMP-acid ligase II